MKQLIKYIFIAVAWGCLFTLMNILKDKEGFLEFMKTKEYIFELGLYMLGGIFVTFLVSLRKNK